MGLPEQPVELSPAQIEELNKKLSTMRHNVNNYLALVVAGTELIRRKPELAAKFLDSIGQQPDRIVSEIRTFSDHFEATCQITRKSPPAQQG